jgi:hypothetical protein
MSQYSVQELISGQREIVCKTGGDFMIEQQDAICITANLCLLSRVRTITHSDHDPVLALALQSSTPL